MHSHRKSGRKYRKKIVAYFYTVDYTMQFVEVDSFGGILFYQKLNCDLQFCFSETLLRR